MRKLLLFGGLIIVIIASVIATRTFQEYSVAQSGKYVEVLLLKLPACTGHKNNFMTFTYNGREYLRRVKCKYLTQRKPGDKVEMIHADGTDVFLFKEENIDEKILMNALLILLGLATIIFALRRKN